MVCKGRMGKVLLQRCDTESITLEGITGGRWRGDGEEGGNMPNRQNHIRMNHTREQQNPTEKKVALGRQKGM